MQKVIGTQTGRIFLCGSDGCLYEVDYSLQVGLLEVTPQLVGWLVPQQNTKAESYIYWCILNVPALLTVGHVSASNLLLQGINPKRD